VHANFDIMNSESCQEVSDCPLSFMTLDIFSKNWHMSVWLQLLIHVIIVHAVV